MAEPTTGQRRLLIGLFVFAAVVFVVGIVVIGWVAGVI
jgi:hypothetical protein